MKKLTRYPGPQLPGGLQWSDYPPFGYIGDPPEDVTPEYSQQVDSDGVIHDSWVPKLTNPKHILYELWEQRARKCYGTMQETEDFYRNRFMGNTSQQQPTQIIIEQKSFVGSVFKAFVIVTLLGFLLVLFAGIFSQVANL